MGSVDAADRRALFTAADGHEIDRRKVVTGSTGPGPVAMQHDEEVWPRLRGGLVSLFGLFLGVSLSNGFSCHTLDIVARDS